MKYERCPQNLGLQEKKTNKYHETPLKAGADNTVTQK